MPCTCPWITFVVGLSAVWAPVGAPLQESEPNDAFAAAKAIPAAVLPAAAIEGFLGPDATPSGVDYFSFPVTSTATMVTASIFDYTPREYDNDSILGVFHPAGVLVEVNDDGNPGLLSSIHYFPAVAGQWAVAFGGLPDADFDGNGHSLHFDYRVVISTGASATETEPNDTLSTAQTLPATLWPAGAVAIEGSLARDTTAHGIDYYSFQVRGGTLVTASVFDFTPQVSNDNISLLGVFGPEGSLLARDEDSGPGLLSAIHLVARQSGRHTLAVTGFGDKDFDGVGHRQSFNYRLVVSVPEPGSLALLLVSVGLAALGL